VAAGLWPAVEPGVPPGGLNAGWFGAFLTLVPPSLESPEAGRQDAALYVRRDA